MSGTVEIGHTLKTVLGFYDLVPSCSKPRRFVKQPTPRRLVRELEPGVTSGRVSPSAFVYQQKRARLRGSEAGVPEHGDRALAGGSHRQEGLPMGWMPWRRVLSGPLVTQTSFSCSSELTGALKPHFRASA